MFAFFIVYVFNLNLIYIICTCRDGYIKAIQF